MTAVFDCKAIAQKYLDWVTRSKAELGFSPCLATVLFQPERNPASSRYRDLILKDAAELGFKAKSIEIREEKKLLATIQSLDGDEEVTGVIVFYPLNAAAGDEDVMDLVSPRKDVEGLHSLNLGYLIKYKQFVDEPHRVKCVVPATAKGVVKTIQHYPEIRLAGAFVTIVNNSMRVGKPLGLMLENLGATVVKCYDKTTPSVLEECVRRSDIVITAVPDPAFSLNPEWIKKSAAVLDVSFQGNIDARALEGRASFVTSAGNRIGQVTRAMMFVNLVYCAGQRHLYEPSLG